ncbi:MAG: FtsX-like permease family protein [Alphaproteobacteria bacterium]|nr:MAG: FtsX-like permease family protein [Alphaproteobacteria bacterium]
MWRNYLTVGFRALTKSRTYAFINIAGLALGLAACILILLYVRYETSFEKWLPDAGRVYQVQTLYTDPETGNKELQQGTEGVITETLPKDFPQIEAIARAEGDRPVLLNGADANYADLLRADPTFFQILKIPFLAGNPKTALDGADSLVISRKEAVKRFGTPNALGRTVTGIRRGEKYEMRVTGVFEDLPKNSHLGFNLVAKIRDTDKADCGWGCINGVVYLKLRPGASADDINRQLPAWEKRNIPTANVNGAVVSEGDAFDWKLVPVKDVHLSGAEAFWEDHPGNDRSTIITFAIVALLILGMACVNFINLATARASQRAREVALRKVLGANRSQLVVQFLGESMLLTTVAMLIALAMAELALPWLADFLRADLHMTYWGWDGLLLPALGLLLVVGIAGGLYPAFYLSRFQPSAVLRANKSTAEPAGSGRLRNLLVVAQFAVSIGLIVCTSIVYAQTRFAQTSDAGYKREGLIQAMNFNRAQIVPLTETVLREVSKVPGVTSAAGSNIRVATGQTLNTRIEVPGKTQPVTIGWYSAHPDFFKTMGIRTLAGRTLSRQYAKDNGFLPYEPEEAVDPAIRAQVARGLNVVVNELAAKQMGFPTPASAIGKEVKARQYGEKYGSLPITIVGVVQDSRFRSLRDPVEPAIFLDQGIYSALIVRYDSSDPVGVLKGVERVWKRLAPDVPFEGDFADAQLAELYQTDQARGTTFAGFAMLAVVIACLGLFGLAAFTAERRTKEIGIRKVFGARARDIVQLLAWQFSKPVIVANLIAWPAAWWVMRGWLNGFDARIPLGPGPFLTAGLLALAIALGTIAGHAIKVARSNPIHALRYE